MGCYFFGRRWLDCYLKIYANENADSDQCGNYKNDGEEKLYGEAELFLCPASKMFWSFHSILVK